MTPWQVADSDRLFYAATQCGGVEQVIVRRADNGLRVFTGKPDHLSPHAIQSPAMNVHHGAACYLVVPARNGPIKQFTSGFNRTGVVLRGLLVGLCKDVRLARIKLTLDTMYYPIARADNVPTFEGIYPSVNVHHQATMLAGCIARYFWMAEVADNITLPIIGFSLISGEYSKLSAFKAFMVSGVVQRVVAILKPLSRFDYDWLFTEFHTFLA